LQKLEFDVFKVEDDIQENSVNVLSIESLQKLPLTHLSLSHPLINDKVFDKMSHFIPNLKVLSLYVIHITDDITDNITDNITDKALKSISELKNLSKITIDSSNDTMDGITDSGVMAIIENCPKINSIRIKVKSNVTHKTIDALIALALRKPRIQFKHLLSNIEKLEDSSRDIEENTSHVVNLKSYLKPITTSDRQSFEEPKNLKIYY
jgi:hypothetical protein